MRKEYLKLYLPKEYHKSIYEIDFVSHMASGKNIIFFDLDNTIEDYDHYTPNERVIELFSRLKKLGYEILFISNNGKKRLKNFIDILDVKCFTHVRKPFTFKIKKYLKESNYSVENILFVGDQIVTDIKFSRKLGIYAILVDPINRSTERWYTKINRFFENIRLNQIKKELPCEFMELGLDKR